MLIIALIKKNENERTHAGCDKIARHIGKAIRNAGKHGYRDYALQLLETNATGEGTGTCTMEGTMEMGCPVLGTFLRNIRAAYEGSLCKFLFELEVIQGFMISRCLR